MSNKETGEGTGKEAVPTSGSGGQTSRRDFSKLGLGAPVLMTLASQPVFGANCLSNAISGNLSDPDRGDCSFGVSSYSLGQGPQSSTLSFSTQQAPEEQNRYGILSETPLVQLINIFPIDLFDQSLDFFLENGNDTQRLVVAAYINANITPNYILSQEQLLQLASGQTMGSSGPISIPYGMSLESFLAWTMPGS